jgi:DNA-binding NarL/FixJ family response regulator
MPGASFGGADAVRSSPIPIAPSLGSASSHRESWRKNGIALIDQFPLRRASALNLLRAHFREGARPFEDIAELLSQVSLSDDLPCGVIMSVGGRSIMEAQLSTQLRSLRRALPATPVIVLSDREETSEVVAAFQEGARAYVPTGLEPGLVIKAIRMVLAGGTFVPADALMRWRQVAALANGQRSNEQRFNQEQPVSESLNQWTPRQLAVLHILVQGKANKEIARTLAMEESTVKVHVRHIMRKLGVSNRTQAALRARRLGIPVALDDSHAPIVPVAPLASPPVSTTSA